MQVKESIFLYDNEIKGDVLLHFFLYNIKLKFEQRFMSFIPACVCIVLIISWATEVSKKIV